MNRRGFVGRTSSAALAGLFSPWATSALAGGAPTRVRVAMFGAAHAHAAGKLATLQQLSEDFEVVGVVEPDAQWRQRLESHSKIAQPRWLTEEEALRPGAVDAAVVETTVGDVVPVARQCLAAGLHVHIEKPPGESLPDFAALLAAANAGGRHVQVGYMFRYNPAFQFALRAVREGWLGNIFEASGTISKLVPAAARKELAVYRGGAMFELGCHLIDNVVAMLGPPQQVTSFGNATRPRQDDLVDNQLAVLHYPQAIASIRSSVLEPNGQQRRQLTIVGDRGTLEIRPFEPPAVKLTLAEAGAALPAGEHAPTLPPSAGRYHDQLREFAAVIRQETAPAFSSDHDLAVHRVVLEASNLPGAKPARS